MSKLNFINEYIGENQKREDLVFLILEAKMTSKSRLTHILLTAREKSFFYFKSTQNYSSQSPTSSHLVSLKISKRSM